MPNLTSAQEFQHILKRPIIDYKGSFHRDYFPLDVSGLDTCTTDFGLEKVCFEIDHPRISDLKIELLSPSGQSIWLSNRNGGDQGRNYQSTCLSQNGFKGYIFEGFAPYGGDYIPDGRMGILNNNSDPNGTWFLIISDLAEGETGILKSWKLTFGDMPAIETASFCTEENPSACICDDLSTDCLLLPDLIVSYKISANHHRVYDESHQRYAHQIRLAAALANVGDGPFEFESTDTWLCGTDTVSGSQKCDDGHYSRCLVNQRIYNRKNDSFAYVERPAGTIYFSDEPGHDHFHADNWVSFKLLKKRWYSSKYEKYKEVKKGSKISYCLFDSGICTEENGFCQDENGGFYGVEDLPNYGLGTYNSCESSRQGISVGGLDYYGLDFEGQLIQLDGKLRKCRYLIEVTVDPENKFLEKNESNNTIYLPLEI